MARWILHVDMDAFFASVEQILDPNLAGKPVIVAGPAEERGVVSAASYDARKYGIRSAMPTAQARRLCPDGIFVPGHHAAYDEYSGRVLAILKRYTPLVEQTSIDEAYLDVTGCGETSAEPAARTLRQRVATDAVTARSQSAVLAMARAVKDDIRRETGLTCSVGVASTRLLAKTASGLEKPDGLTVLLAKDVPRVLWPRPVGDLHGVGPRTAARLRSLGLLTVGELARYPLDLLLREFGVTGRYLHDAANGLNDTPVRPAGAPGEAKSLSRETTFVQDVGDVDTLEVTLLELSDEVGRRLRRHGLRGRTVTVKVRKADFSTVTRSRSLSGPTDLGEEIYREARLALGGFWRPSMRVRLLGVGVSNVEPNRDGPGLLFDASEKLRRVSRAIDRIKERYGERSVTRARLLGSAGWRGPGGARSSDEVRGQNAGRGTDETSRASAGGAENGPEGETEP